MEGGKFWYLYYLVFGSGAINTTYAMKSEDQLIKDSEINDEKKWKIRENKFYN